MRMGKAIQEHGGNEQVKRTAVKLLLNLGQNYLLSIGERKKQLSTEVFTSLSFLQDECFEPV